MRRPTLLFVGALLGACAAEVAPQVDAETVEAAVEHAQLEMERATAPEGNANSGASK